MREPYSIVASLQPHSCLRYQVKMVLQSMIRGTWSSSQIVETEKRQYNLFREDSYSEKTQNLARKDKQDADS